MYMIRPAIAALMIFCGSAASVFCQNPTRTGARRAPLRVERPLNEGWRFTPSDESGAEKPSFNDLSWQRVNVPHTWNNEDAFDETPGYRRGASWYRRELSIGRELAGKDLALYFEGANQVAELYVNGRFIGKHVGGYTAFSFDITKAVSVGRANVVAIRVDNSFDADIPPLTADFNMYGGIYRDVQLIAVDPLHFKIDDHASSGVRVTTPHLSAESGEVVVSGVITNSSDRDRSVEVESRIF